MKIAHVVSTFPPYKGGIGNVCYHLSRQLTAKGHDVTVFTPRGASSNFDQGGIKVMRLRPWLAVGNAAIMPQLAWHLRNFDIIHVHYPFLGAEALWFIKLFRKNKIVLQYQMDLVGQGFRRIFFSIYNLLVAPVLIRFSDLVLFSSRDYFENSLAKKMLGSRQTKADVLANGVDTDFFYCQQPPSELGQPQASAKLLFVGGLDRAHYFKGLNNLMKAMSQIDEAHLTVVGSGDLQAEYMRMAEELGIIHKVTFAGSVNDQKLVEQYCQADILILPSIDSTEAYGLVLLEAMACNCPVIASNLPGVRTLVNDGEDGLLVTPGDIVDLRRAITALINDPAKQVQFGESGRHKVVENYSWSAITSKLEQFYRDLSTSTT